jgi:uncharacterized protein (DUF2252 family)
MEPEGLLLYLQFVSQSTDNSLSLRNLKAHRCFNHLCLKVLTTAEELYEFHESSNQLFILDLNNSPPQNPTHSIVMILHTRHLNE